MHTDHFRQRYGFPITDTSPYRRDGFTTLLGAELHAPATSLGEDWHLLAVGLPPDFPPKGPSEGGVFVGIAHPAWYGLTPKTPRASRGAAHAIEVYNHSASEDNDRGDGWYLADALLAEGRRVNAYAAGDAHLRKARPTPSAGG